MTTNKSTKSVTTSKVVTIDKEQLPEVFANKDSEFFVTKRAEVDAYISELQESAGTLRKNFDRLLEMAKGQGFATEVAPLRKPREKGDPADPFNFL